MNRGPHPWGANLIPALRLAPRTVIVMDATEVYVGLRRDVTIAYSDQVRFESDQVVARVTSRWAGVGLTDTKAVRVLTKAVSGTDRRGARREVSPGGPEIT